MHKINKTAVVFLRRYATLFIKKTQYLLSRLRMNSLWRRTILNGLRLRSGHVQRKNILNFAFVALCGALQTLFSREGYPAKTKPAKPAGLAGLKAIDIP